MTWIYLILAAGRGFKVTLLDYNSMKESIKKLYCLQIQENGITREIHSNLSKDEQGMLRENNNRFFLKDEYKKQIKIVLTGGVFDILHMGHIFTLNEAKKYGDVLIVAIANDKHVEKKGRKMIHSQEYRAKMVEFLKPVDAALLGKENPDDILELVKPDVIVFGYDQDIMIKTEGIKIVKLEKRIEETKFKTSKIIEELGV